MRVLLPVFACLAVTSLQAATYVGSRACQSCHAATYATWEKTPMANIVRDPKLHPDQVKGDFSKTQSACHLQAC